MTATYGRQQSSAKERVSILSKNQHDDLQRLQMASAAGVDIQRFEGIVRDVLGIQKQTITGEITFKKEGDSIAYQVRMRRLPETRCDRFDGQRRPPGGSQEDRSCDD